MNANATATAGDLLSETGAWRQELSRLCLTVVVALGLALPLVARDRPPEHPRLTFIGGGDGLSLLLEGAGGGRVLVGGGDTHTAVPAALGRHLRPWDQRLDLLLVADGRDLPGAVELVRHGDVRAVAILGHGLEEARSNAAALAALRDACAGRAVPLRVVEGVERLRVGRDEGLTLEVSPAIAAGEGAALRLVGGRFTAVIVAGAPAPSGVATGAVLLRNGQEPYRAALAAGSGLIVAPGPPPATTDGTPAWARQLLIVGAGERATLSLEGRVLRLRGPMLQALRAP